MKCVLITTPRTEYKCASCGLKSSTECEVRCPHYQILHNLPSQMSTQGCKLMHSAIENISKKKKRQKSNKWKWCSIIWQCGSWYVMSYQAAKLKFQRQYLFTVRLSFLQLSGDSSFLLFNWHAEAAPSATRWTVHTQAICCKFVPDTKSLWTSPVHYIKS